MKSTEEVVGGGGSLGSPLTGQARRALVKQIDSSGPGQRLDGNILAASRKRHVWDQSPLSAGAHKKALS
ncbi:hypothetical protein SKAU_G00033260 [Synaphobranchus kaupii]|uniref:Uncharacterized protein n=1 Tax=Synaphobranchus kaupii TaxID=118154 RepID=A0A9Q1GFD5_SYNKA|nr:hypothetical protein SKAU_G00033260 [Synaphobranchus kaupii]